MEDGGFVDGLFYVLPSLKKVCSLLDSGLNLYKPLLASHAAPTSQVDSRVPAGLKGNLTMLQNDVDQQQSIEPSKILEQ
jgi:hypothetical protein